MMVEPSQSITAERHGLQNLARRGRREAHHENRCLLLEIRHHTAKECHQLRLGVDPDPNHQTNVSCQENRSQQRISISMRHNRDATPRLRARGGLGRHNRVWLRNRLAIAVL